MRQLRAYQRRLRDWPRAASYPTTVVLLLSVYATYRWLWPPLQAYPFFLYFPAIIVTGALFDHGTGYLAAGLSTVLVALVLPPMDSLWVVEPRDAFVLIVFLFVGLFLSALMELLHHALNQAEAAQEQAKLFLSEAVHRFKNDMSIVVALLRSQSRQIQDPQAKAALTNTVNRVLVMARVHERLRAGRGAEAWVDTRAFICTLCNDLTAGLVDLRPITVVIEAEPHDLPHDKAVAVGLIINEALTNALKYAFPDDRPGQVKVVFYRKAAMLKLEVRDDGVGFDPEREPSHGGLGRRLVQSMAQQIGGSLTIAPDAGAPGTIVTVTFPAP